MSRMTSFIIGGLDGMILCMGAVFSRKRPDVPRWTYSLVGLLGFFAFCWSMLGIVVLYRLLPLTAHAARILEYCRGVCAGIAIGLFLAWCLSGEFRRALNRKGFV